MPVDRFYKGLGTREVSAPTFFPAGQGTCPLCGQKVTRAFATSQKHVSQHIRSGELEKGLPAKRVMSQIFQR